MLVNLLIIPVGLEETSEDALASNPDHLLWHTGVGRTLPLTSASVATLATCQLVLANASSRVHGLWLADDKTVLDQFANVLPCYSNHRMLEYRNTP